MPDCSECFEVFDFLKNLGPFGSVVEHSLGKGEVAGPIPAKGTNFWGLQRQVCNPSAYVEIVFFGVEKWQKVNSPAPSRT